MSRTPRASTISQNAISLRGKSQTGSDYEEFASLQLDKPNEGELKSNEEMKRHLFDDHFEGRPVERAMHILAVGEEVQKLSVIRDLPNLMRIDEQGCLQRVIQKIQVALNSATTEFHIETARAFSFLLEQKTISNIVFAQSFLPCIIYHVDNRDQVVSNAWLDTLLKSVELLPLDIVKTSIASVAINKGQISQNLWSRIAACKLLGRLCSRFDPQSVKKDVLPIVLSLCQDVNELVRACICSQLPLVAKGIPSDMIKPALIPILVELGRDETVQVRVEAIEAIVKIMPSLSQEVLKVTIIPLIKKMCEQAVLATDETLVSVAKQFGGVCIGLEHVLTQSEKLWMVSYYHNLSHMGIPVLGPKKEAFFTSHNVDRLNARYVECRQNCAYNFPAMAKFCSSSPELLEKLYPSFCDFSTDPYYMVRKTIGAGMHEVARILGSNNRVVKNQVMTLLWDNMEEVLTGIVPQLSKTIESLISSGVLGRDQENVPFDLGRGLLQCDKTIRDKTHNWRLQTEFITQLESIVKCLPSDYIYSHFVTLMFDKMHRARPLPCRLAAARTLLVFLRYNMKNTQRQEIRFRLQSEFCSSSSCYKRMLYLRLCNAAREVFSRAYFKEHFFYPLLSRSEDKVANNRLLLLRQFPSLKAMIIMPSEKKYLQTLESCLRSMAVSEKDRDVTAELRSLIYRIDKTETLFDNATTQTPEDVEDRRKYDEELRVANAGGRQGVSYMPPPNDTRKPQKEAPKAPAKPTELKPAVTSTTGSFGAAAPNISPRTDQKNSYPSGVASTLTFSPSTVYASPGSSVSTRFLPSAPAPSPGSATPSSRPTSSPSPGPGRSAPPSSVPPPSASHGSNRPSSSVPASPNRILSAPLPTTASATAAAAAAASGSANPSRTNPTPRGAAPPSAYPLLSSPHPAASSAPPTNTRVMASYGNAGYTSHQGSFQGFTNTTNHVHPVRSLSTHLTSLDQSCTCYPPTNLRSENLRNLNLLALIDTSLVNSKQKLSEALRQKLLEDPRIKLTKSGKRSMEISWLNLETDLEKELLALSKNRQIQGDRNFKEKSKFLTDFRNYNESNLRKFISEDKECKETIYNVTGVGGCCERSSNFFEERINFFERKIKLEDQKPNSALGDCSCYELTTGWGKPFDDINKFSYFSKNFEEDFYRDAGVKANEIICRKFSGILPQEKLPTPTPTPAVKVSGSAANKRRTWFAGENSPQGSVKLETITGCKPKSVERKKSETLPSRESVSLKKLGIGPRSKSFVLPSTFIYASDKPTSDFESTKQDGEKEEGERGLEGETEVKPEVESEEQPRFDSDANRFGFRAKTSQKASQPPKEKPKTKIPVGIAGNCSPGGSRSSSPALGKTETAVKPQTNGKKKIPVVVSRKSMLVHSNSVKTEVKNNRRSFDPSKISLENMDKVVPVKKRSDKTGGGKERGENEEKGEAEATCNGNLSRLPVRRPKPDK